MLRGHGIPRPVGVTWAGFGIAAAANVLLDSLGSVTISPFMGGLPMAGPNLDIDPSDTDWGQQDWGDGLPENLDIDPSLLEQLADPAPLVAFASPWWRWARSPRWSSRSC